MRSGMIRLSCRCFPLMQNALSQKAAFNSLTNKMPGIPKGLLRLCPFGRKKRFGPTANPVGSQKGSLEHDLARDLHVTADPNFSRSGSDPDYASTSGASDVHVEDMAYPRVWRPLACLEDKHQDMKLALILLNQPMEVIRQQLKVLWSRSVLKAAADGGANRLYECMMGNHQKYIPDIVSGDFDSIRPEVLLYFQSRGAKMVKTPDQNYTDFTKCLRIVLNTVERNTLKLDAVVVLGAFGGRLDQTLANVNTLLEAGTLTELPVYALSDGSLGCILRPGKHVIEVNTGLEGEWCGLIPIGVRCRQVTSTGLKWNLDHQPMQFGGLISTSNTYAEGAEVVTVQTDQPLLWTMGFKEKPEGASKS